MQVRKFEARSMKDALEMVKTELGPDAIILSAKDHQKSFGLVGQGSVEITAAVSEATLHRKKFTESRMVHAQKERFQRSPAKNQKQVIHNFVNNYIEDQAPQPPPPPKREATNRRYIEIEDDFTSQQMMDGSNDPASERIRGAAQRAWSAMQVHEQTSNVKIAQGNQEINILKNEIETLKQVLSGFQKMPQQMSGQHPGSQYGLNYDMSATFEKLTHAGVSPDIVAEMLTQAQKEMPALKAKNKALVDAWAAKQILSTTKILNSKPTAQIQVFVGPSGAGKTATLVKMASHAVVEGRKKIAILTTDTLKVGASEQLKIYSQILNIPFGVIKNVNDWQFAMKQFATFDQIFVDFPGLSLKSVEENSFVRTMLPTDPSMAQVHLVLSATMKDSDMTEIGRRYHGFGFRDVIFTALDESMQHGTIYNFMKRFDCPIHSFGIGPKVPEDFELASKERVLDLIFKLTAIKRD